MTLRIGQRAPELDVTTSSGERLRLSDFAGKKIVVLYFYPRDFTFVCTRETCGFRDAEPELAAEDAVVVGVSVDSDESHRRFAAEHRVPFALVSDPDRKLADAYETTGKLGRLLSRNGRVTYVIDKRGLIAGVFDSELRASVHVDGVRELVRRLSKEK